MKILRKAKIQTNLGNHQSLNKETLNITHFLFFIAISLFLAIIFFYVNTVLNLNIENTMTGYIAILGSIPTIYLWIIKERKKEVELENKRKELYQYKISELNKVYVDAINQIYKEESFLAGAYSLYGLISDWISLYNISKTNEKEINTKIEQLSGILYSFNTIDYNKNPLYTNLISELTYTLFDLQKNGWQFHWRFFDLNHIYIPNIDLSDLNLRGIKLDNANLKNANLKNTILNKANLTGAILSCADLTNVTLSGAILNKTNLTKTKLNNADLHNIKLNGATLIRANLSNTNLTNAKLNNANLDRAILKNSNLAKADLTNTSLNKTIIEDSILTDTILKNIKRDLYSS